ncbi:MULTISPECIES: zinc-dependent metalloprotease [Haloferacaceae]|uniref:Zinc-dependent metalloprotease n=1 Tax=Halorubrum glutamatedens TaxID=2707018 RepID=A0ABD5QNZ3_9EURY|nr:zinc-dependent metalloprotease [Halobellus captivus]
MDILRSLRAVSEASGTGVVDWAKAGEAARASTAPGTLDLTPADRRGYATDVRDARDRLREVAGVDFAVPDAIEVQNRHHWIDANLETFRNVMGPIESAATPAMPGLSRVVNTGSMAFVLGFLARNVLGQYDPLLLADEPDADHGLYFVHPNVVAVAADLDVAYPRFRRWIAFHEVTHAAEFGAAPWLSGYLESRVERGIDGLSASGLDPDAFVELQTAMTAVEGYAELLMDRAFDDEYADLRRKVDERRGGGGPVTRIARRLLGLGLKRRQYERGAAFFERVADERGLAAASAVWERPEHLPTDGEIDDPDAWLARVDP